MSSLQGALSGHYNKLSYILGLMRAIFSEVRDLEIFKGHVTPNKPPFRGNLLRIGSQSLSNLKGRVLPFLKIVRGSKV